MADSPAPRRIVYENVGITPAFVESWTPGTGPLTVPTNLREELAAALRRGDAALAELTLLREALNALLDAHSMVLATPEVRGLAVYTAAVAARAALGQTEQELT
jgi:hypothetical protein